MKKIIKPHKTKSGFTMVEVMLFLAISGLLLIGVLGGTYRNIATQRYNDSVRSFAEFLRQMYAEVISPESIGGLSTPTNSEMNLGNSDEYAIYGKLLVFGLNDANNEDDLVYTATLVGDVTIPQTADGFLTELDHVQATVFCGTADGTFESSVRTYLPLWGSKLENAEQEQFKGTIIIARSPASGTIHTAYSTEQFDLKENCNAADGDQSAVTEVRNGIHDNAANFSITEPTNFCIKSKNSNIIRDVRLAADGRNTSAVNILTEDNEESVCR